MRPAAFRIPGRRAKAHARLYGPLLGAAALVTFPCAAFSQVVAPSQVTPETLRPAPATAPGGLLLSGAAGLRAPPGAEALSVTVGHLTIEGAFLELDRADAGAVGHVSAKANLRRAGFGQPPIAGGPFARSPIYDVGIGKRRSDRQELRTWVSSAIF